MSKRLNGVGILLEGDEAVEVATQPQFVTDLIRLGNDAMGWLIAISAVVAVICLMVEGMKWYQAEENEKSPHTKKIKGILIGAVGIIIAEAVVALVLSYFTH